MDTDSAIIIYDSGKLFGRAGGQLEYVSQRISWVESPSGKFSPIMVIRFIDHDHKFEYLKDMPAVEGMVDNQYYEIEFPLSDW